MLLQNKLFTGVAVLALALGIAANTTIFSVVNALLLRPLPYRDAGRILSINSTNPDGSPRRVSAADLIDWREQNQVFEHLSSFEFDGFHLAGEGEPEVVNGAFVSPNIFSLLGVEVARGRNFLAADDQADAEPAVIISHSLWQRRFSGAADIVGRKVTLHGIDNTQEGEYYTVVGVLPPNFWFLSGQFEAWVPHRLSSEQINNRGASSLHVIGRLKPDVTVEQARADMARISGNLAREFPETNEGRGVNMTTLHEAWMGEIGAAFLFLLIAVCFVLLIACANAASLLLARATARQKEISIRAALGARRWRIVRQLLTESILLSTLAGVLGLLLAKWSIVLVVKLIPPEAQTFIPSGAESIGTDMRVLLFTLGVSVLTGIIFGLAPAVAASKPNLNAVLKESGVSSPQMPRHQRIRKLLILAELALSTALLIGAGVMIKGFLELQRAELGFNPEGVLKVDMFLPRAKYAEAEQQAAFYNQLLQRTAAQPGVTAASVSNHFPLRPTNRTLFIIEGRPIPNRNAMPAAVNGVISPDYFKTLGINLLKGRYFTDADTPESPQVAIVSETMARRYWPEEDPLGKRFRPGGVVSLSPWVTIVGVVADSKQELSAEPAFPALYRPLQQTPQPFMFLLARTSTDPNTLVAPLRQQMAEIDKDQPVAGIATMEQVIAEAGWGPRFLSLLLGMFGVLALGMAAMGIYGMMSYLVAQRTQEIGIRIALGAQPRHIYHLIVGGSMFITTLGILLGVAGGVGAAVVLSTMLVEVSSAEPLVYLGVGLFLFLVAVVASYVPARRATKVDPIRALRS
jgi:putative ABC transport system permease protein